MALPQRPDKHADAIVKRVSRRNHEEEGGGAAWKIAFADFCLALSCLFMVLWVMAARNQERIEQVVRAMGGTVLEEGRGRVSFSSGGQRGTMIEHENPPLPLGWGTQRAGSDVGNDRHGPATRTRYESPAELAELAQVLKDLSEQVGLSGNLNTLVTPYGLRVMLHDTDRQGMFERGSAVPSPRLQQLLHRIGPLFSRLENQMLIIGHTDALPYAEAGPAAYSNWSLSTERAMAARAELLDGGMTRGSILQVVGMADRAPLDTSDPRAPVNRRIEMLILTSGQAHAIAAMFGTAGNTHPLDEGVDTALPDAAALNALRNGVSVKEQGEGGRAR
jgi:chemotaxis protein MotB